MLRVLKPEKYTFFVASNRRGTIRKFTIPSYALHVLLVLVLIGGVSLAVAVASYSQMLWKVAHYDALIRKQDTLQQQFRNLQKTVQNTDQRLSSLQSLATEVAMTYGFFRFRDNPFTLTASFEKPAVAYEHTVAEFEFLEENATMAGNRLRLIPSPGPGLGELMFTPTLWPVVGYISGGFGERLDPFSGEGAFHNGVDISSRYGDEVRAAADGVVVEAGQRSGYGRLVVVDHGFGVTSWYGHLSSFTVSLGMQVRRGDRLGYVGVSGRTTGPHVHYEVRINNAPVNPTRYLRYASTATSAD